MVRLIRISSIINKCIAYAVAVVTMFIIGSVALNAYKPSLRSHAEKINNKDLSPGSDKNTILCLDRLLSQDTTDTDLYYGVYLAMLERNDDESRAVLKGYIKDYMILKPDLFIERYSSLSQNAKESFARLMAEGIIESAQLSPKEEAKALIRYIGNYINDRNDEKERNLAMIEKHILENIDS